MTDRQVISKKRVAEHGEVYTHRREVDAMLDLVKPETERIESRFLDIFSQHYSKLYKTECKQSLLEAVRYILSCNIAHGDALTLKTVGDAQHCRPIVFSEWSAVNGSLIKRRDFIYAHLVDTSSHREMPLFSDLDELAYIPEPVHEYPLTHYLEVGNAG
jgi:hypothetical protein